MASIQPSGVDAAARILLGGGIVVYPTETLYGLGADATNPQALRRLIELKGREPGKPVAVLVADIEMASELAASISASALRLALRFWPGPLTLVLPARPSVSEWLTGGSGTIGVRVSSHAVAGELVRRLGRPLTTPSANPAGAAAPLTLAVALGYFGDRVDAYVDGGVLAGEPASSVVRADKELQIMRAGAIPAAALQAAWEGN